MDGGYPALQFWYNIVQGLMMALLFLYTKRMTKQKAAEDRFRRIEEVLAKTTSPADCGKHVERTTRIETKVSEITIEMTHLPTHRQIAELNKGIQDLNGELRNTQGRLEGINRAVDLINEFLINSGAKRV